MKATNSGRIKHCLAITLFLKMLQDFMAAAYTCRPQITAKGQGHPTAIFGKISVRKTI